MMAALKVGVTVAEKVDTTAESLVGCLVVMTVGVTVVVSAVWMVA